jgi:predicted GNAT family N-acyltransferase
MTLLILDLITKFTSIHIAKTAEEKNAIARFGFDIYVKELGYTPPGIDFKNQRLWDRLDECPSTIHIYIGSVQQIKAVLRLLVWEKGNIDNNLFELYSMNLFPKIENNNVVEIGRVMISPSIRGKYILAALVRFACKLVLKKGLADLIFSECRPGLLPRYTKLGLRLYKAPLNKTPEGFMVPLVAIPSDYQYHKNNKSLIYDLIPKYFGPKKRTPLDISLYNHLFEDSNQRIFYDKQMFFSKIANEFHSQHKKIQLFDNITDEEIQIIIQKGILLDISRQTETLTKGRKESEIFIILEGSFNVIVDEKIVSTLKQGDIFGEMAFFLESGRRTATIKSATTGKILMLDRKCFQRIQEKHSELALKILFNLGRILSHKLDTLSQCRSLEL